MNSITMIGFSTNEGQGRHPQGIIYFEFLSDVSDGLSYKKGIASPDYFPHL